MIHHTLLRRLLPSKVLLCCAEVLSRIGGNSSDGLSLFPTRCRIDLKRLVVYHLARHAVELPLRLLGIPTLILYLHFAHGLGAAVGVVGNVRVGVVGGAFEGNLGPGVDHFCGRD